ARMASPAKVRPQAFRLGPRRGKSAQSFNNGALTLKRCLRKRTSAIAPLCQRSPTRNAAEAARGTELTVPRSALPPLGRGEYYHADVVGLPVVSETGEPLGTVRAIEDSTQATCSITSSLTARPSWFPSPPPISVRTALRLTLSGRIVYTSRIYGG
ncbi:hypothetical protein ACFOGK_18130, partial [Blastomonas aquatica]